MHELSIVLSIIDQVIETCAERELDAVDVVHLRVGTLSGVDGQALLYAWQVAREGTVLDRAELEIERVPLVIRCEQCGRNRTPSSLYELSCSSCSSPEQTILTGQELELVSLEITV